MNLKTDLYTLEQSIRQMAATKMRISSSAEEKQRILREFAQAEQAIQNLWDAYYSGELTSGPIPDDPDLEDPDENR